MAGVWHASKLLDRGVWNDEVCDKTSVGQNHLSSWQFASAEELSEVLFQHFLLLSVTTTWTSHPLHAVIGQLCRETRRIWALSFFNLSICHWSCIQNKWNSLMPSRKDCFKTCTINPNVKTITASRFLSLCLHAQRPHWVIQRSYQHFSRHPTITHRV